MNHDATHCSAYERKSCPGSCYRGQLTEELPKRGDLVWLPVSWADFKYSEECPLCTLPFTDKKRRSSR